MTSSRTSSRHSTTQPLGNPVLADGTLIPASLSTFPDTTGSFYLNGIREAGVNGFPRGNVHDHYYTFQPRVGFA